MSRSGWRSKPMNVNVRPLTALEPNELQLHASQLHQQQLHQLRGVQVKSDEYRSQQEALKQQQLERSRKAKMDLLAAPTNSAQRTGIAPPKKRGAAQRRVAPLPVPLVGPATGGLHEWLYEFDSAGAPTYGEPAQIFSPQRPSGGLLTARPRGFARKDLLGRPIDFPSCRHATLLAWSIGTSPRAVTTADAQQQQQQQQSQPPQQPPQQQQQPASARVAQRGASPTSVRSHGGNSSRQGYARSRSHEDSDPWDALQPDGQLAYRPRPARDERMSGTTMQGLLTIRAPVLQGRRDERGGAVGGALPAERPHSLPAPATPRLPMPPMTSPAPSRHASRQGRGLVNGW